MNGPSQSVGERQVMSGELPLGDVDYRRSVAIQFLRTACGGSLAVAIRADILLV
jgi:hypothetical protein